MDISKKYTEGLTKPQVEELKKNIKKTRKLVKEGKEEDAIKLAEKRPQPKNIKQVKSPFVERFKKIYKITDIPQVNSKEFTKLTGLSMKDQEEIIERGKKAFLTAGSRRGTNAFGWATARLYAFIVKTIEANKKNEDKINQDNDIFERVRNKIRF
jgi:hypothetical protein